MKRQTLWSWLRYFAPFFCVITLLVSAIPIAWGEDDGTIMAHEPDRGELSVDKTVRPSTFEPGAKVVFDIKVQSNGLKTAESILLMDVLDPSLVVDNVWVSHGRLQNSPANPPNSVYAYLGDLLPKHDATVTITTHISKQVAPGTVIWNEARVQWDIGERTPMSKLSKPVTITVAAPAAPPATAQPDVLAAPELSPLDPRPALENTADRWYFAETGHTLAYGFLAYWQRHNGLQLFGYPISEEMMENGRTVQYFERAKLEYWPENKPPYNVLVSDLGRQLYPADPPVPAGPSTYGHRYFAETGHWVHGLFLDYWQANGGLMMFGYPITEQYDQDGVLIQVFERARMEYHPENQGTPYVVQLGLLGEEYLRSTGRIQ
ncbi:MAG: DUF11 domain-containing protein [Chloroflexi bacterium]|nr:DUF11 domain-containing protein [Chloroflexota bacterium]